MTTTPETEQIQPDEPEPTAQPGHRGISGRRGLVVIAVVGALAVALLGAVLVANARDDADGWGVMRQRCEQGAGAMGYDADRCAEMTAWMQDGHRQGRMAAPGMMMNDPAVMGAKCREWMASSATVDEGWCDGMVGAMTGGQHGPGGSMMHGSMMAGR